MLKTSLGSSSTSPDTRTVTSFEVSSGLKLTKTLPEWQALGIRTFEGKALPNVDLDASLVMPDGEKGRIYLAYNNYKSIMRWNRSDYFATSVANLSDAIKFRD